MSNLLPMHPPLATLDDDAWEDLLNFIEEKRVIPIIGPELLKVETDAGPRLLYDWIAEKLAAKLGVDARQLPQPYTLNDVVCWFLSSRGRREEAYTRLRSILREANFAPPPALRRLAQITDFDLYITTTFDPLLEQALNSERFQEAQSTEVIAYAPNRVADLSVERDQLQRPVVYHLLGRLSASPTYVISDEDTLEFVCALQSEHLTPEKLFHELEHNHLLLIGSNFSNWLARLFLRMAKRRRLSDPRDVGEVLADSHTGKDNRLMSFLQQVSVRTRIYTGAEDFVDELHRRWMARRKPGDVIPLGGGMPQRFLPPEREMPDNAIFISYAREDLPAVQRLKAGLDAAGIRTWFDLERLESGDDYDRKIQRNIARCSYFIPIVSAVTERRLEGYFRREWSYAVDRARNIAEGALYILPVCIDETNEGNAQVPDKFKAVHFTRLPAGEATPEFVRRLQELLQARRP
ncbi:MAG TPA: toll/interleukin-1 receptor domain-containing protein [Lacunisphaera sp.]|nr:toll/interleukin-1 receptor domain-containing protein [Lacunisphaera sp.]